MIGKRLLTWSTRTQNTLQSSYCIAARKKWVDVARFGTSYSGDLTDLGRREMMSPDNAATTMNILVVGDGNFSYSRLLAHNLIVEKGGSVRLVATSYDSKEEVTDRYPKSVKILKELKEVGVQVLHRVDATMLPSNEILSKQQRFDRIVFNFPYCYVPGKKNQINRHRDLLNSFFLSAQSVLEEKGEIWVTLCAGQGGTPSEHKKQHWGDTWQIQENATEHGLILKEVKPYPVEKLLAQGYESVGYRLREQGFFLPHSLTHVFVKDTIGVSSFYPMFYQRDMSFWIDVSIFGMEVFESLIRQVVDPRVYVNVQKFDEYTDALNGRVSNAFRLQFSSSRKALSNALVNAYCIDIFRMVTSTKIGSLRFKP